MFQRDFVTITIVLALALAASVPGGVAGRAWKRGGQEEAKDEQQLLGRLVEAVERGLAFFSQDYSSINVDGLFGMRVGQGQSCAGCCLIPLFF